MKKVKLLIVLFLFMPFNTGLAATDFEAALFANDSLVSEQYHLKQIKAYEGWEVAHNSPEIVVAVIDSGVDIGHPDLAANIWRNAGEIANDKIDNDNNGFIDDLNGWDFVANSPDPRPKLKSPYTVLGINHGTVVAGVIGAVGNNNLGVTGVSWKIKIMPLRVMDGEGGGQSTAVYHAINYAIDQKADIINLSMVGALFDPLLDKAIANAYKQGIIIVAASGNENRGAEQEDLSLNLALHPQYPICHDGGAGHNYVLGVGAVDDDDVKSVFSNFGSQCLDLTAPGEGFFSTLLYLPNDNDFKKYYGGWWSGTSLAAPQVAAAAALVKTVNPELSNTDIYRLFIENSDNLDAKNPTFKGLLGAGRLNLAKVLAAAKLAQPSVSLIITSAGAGAEPKVSVFNQAGELQASFLAYHQNFKGGVSLTSGDVNGDGSKEIITGAGAGGGPHVRIFNSTGQVLGQFFAYPLTFSGGVNLAAADTDGDGIAEIVSAPLSKYQPLIKIFDLSGKVKNEWLAFAKNFTGGVNVALADVNNDGTKEIIAAQRSGGNLVRIFSASGNLLRELKAFEAVGAALTADKQGVMVASANLFGDASQEIIVLQNQGAEIRIFSASGDLLQLIKLNKTNVSQFKLNASGAKIAVSFAANSQLQTDYYDFAARLSNSQLLPINYAAGFSLNFY